MHSALTTHRVTRLARFMVQTGLLPRFAVADPPCRYERVAKFGFTLLWPNGKEMGL